MSAGSALISRQAEKATYRDVNHLQPKCAADEIIAEYCCALDSSVCPSLMIRVGDVESRDSYSEDLVGWFGDISLDSFLVRIGEDRRHGEPTGAPGVEEGSGGNEDLEGVKRVEGALQTGGSARTKDGEMPLAHRLTEERQFGLRSDDERGALWEGGNGGGRSERK